jgi:hypothetical protein
MWDLEWGGGHQKWVVFLPRIDGSFLCHFPEYNNMKILRKPERNWFETNSNSILNFLKLTFLLINVKKNVYLFYYHYSYCLSLYSFSLVYFTGLYFFCAILRCFFHHLFRSYHIFSITFIKFILLTKLYFNNKTII